VAAPVQPKSAPVAEAKAPPPYPDAWGKPPAAEAAPTSKAMIDDAAARGFVVLGEDAATVQVQCIGCGRRLNVDRATLASASATLPRASCACKNLI
jgi:hypothetical protein